MAGTPLARYVQQDFQGIPVINFIPETRTTDPATPAVKGRIWTRTDSNKVMSSDGTTNRAILLSGLVADADVAAGAAIAQNKLVLAITNAEIAAGAAIAKSKLAALGIVDADVAGGAAISKAKLGALAIVDADITGPITQAKLTLAITNAEIAAGAAIAKTKLAALGIVDADVTGPIAKAKLASLAIVDADVTGPITEAKLTLASDAAAGTPSRRTIGTGALQALAGNTRLDQLGIPTAAVAMNGQLLTGLGAPVSANDAVRLTDLQVAQAGIDSKPSCRVIATGAITLTAPQTIDGVAVIAGDRVLVAGQAGGLANGPYVVQAGAWTRAADVVNPNSMWYIEEGTINHESQWWATNDGVITLGTTNLAISQYAGAVTVSGTANRITVVGSVLDISAAYVGQASITTLGTIATGVWGGTDIAVAAGGTGASTAAVARTNLGAPRAGAVLAISALTAGVELAIAHGTGTGNAIAVARRVADGVQVDIGIRTKDVTNVWVTSDIAVAGGALELIYSPID